MFLDTKVGTVEYAINDQWQGLAFSDVRLTQKPIYISTISSTNSKETVALMSSYEHFTWLKTSLITN